MKKPTHPLDKMRDQIMERGLMLFDNINRVPIYEKPYVSPFIVFCLNHQGWLKVIYDSQQKEFHQHDLAVIPPGHVMQAQKSSDDYLVSLLVISPRFLEKLRLFRPSSHEHIYHNDLAFHLNDEQYKGIFGYFQMLNAISLSNHLEREVLLANQFEIGARLIEIYHRENGMVTSQESHSVQELFRRFQYAIVNHFHESREVQYYANLLCLSPKYFGSIIKEHTGVSASDWISRYVIINAKSLLRHSQDLNIQQISYELGFPDPAAFTRYFKANAGISPKEYRAQQQNN